jgi:hypothetical protein
MPAARTGMVATRAYVDSKVSSAISVTGSGDLALALAEIRDELAVVSAKSVNYNDAGDAATVSGDLTVTGDLAVGTVDVMSRFSSLETLINAKQDKLTAGSGINISAANLITMSRSVDATVSAGSANLVTSGAVAAYVLGQAFTLPKATTSTLGGVVVGSGLAVNANGVLSSSGELNKIEGVRLVRGSVLTPDGDRDVTIPAATSATYGVVKIDASGSLAVADGVLSCSAQANVLNEVQLAGHVEPLAPTAKRVVIPMATSSGSSGLVKVRDGYGKLYFDADGYLCTTGEANVLTDVTDAVGNSLKTSGGTVATISYASSSAFGLAKVGAGLSAAEGVVSVKVGDGVKTATDGSLQVDFDAVADKDSVDGKADKTDLDTLSDTVANLTVEVSNLEVTSGMSDQLVDCTIGTDGSVALSDHGVNKVPVVAARTSASLVVPSATNSRLARDFYVLLAFGESWTGTSFSVTGVSSATTGETVSVYETATGTFAFTGLAAGDKVMMYFTEVEPGVFMVSSKKLTAHTFS